jgi:hypothetical protein
MYNIAQNLKDKTTNHLDENTEKYLGQINFSSILHEKNEQ